MFSPDDIVRILDRVVIFDTLAHVDYLILDPGGDVPMYVAFYETARAVQAE